MDAGARSGSDRSIGPARQGPVCNLPVGVRIGGDAEALFDDTFSAVSYLASVDYQVDPNILLYAKTSRGFKGGGQNLRGNATIVTGFPAVQARDGDRL